MSSAPGREGEWAEPRPSITPAPPIPLPRRRLRPSPPPTPLTRLVGRDAEVATVVSLLTHRGARLVTLVGPGGIGKTRLALQVAAQCAPAFDNQVAWAPVATARTSEAVAAALAQAVGLAEASATPTIEALKTALRDLRLLLVVDNVEQVLHAASLLSDLLHACPGLSLLVTSRALLRIEGERPVDVPPLATTTDPTGPETMPQTAPAVQLFAQHAASVYPAFALTPENSPAVAEICRRLDGLPLAIELAAARSRLLPPAALLARLERRLSQLSAGQRDAPERHRTMRDAIAWSYDLLSPAEQTVFRCLSAFAGGCTLDAAEAVCQVTPDANLDVSTIIESLVAQSLVQVDPTSGEDDAPAPRLTMLETVHEFAAERLAASGDDTPHRRHAEYVLRLTIPAERSHWTDDHVRWAALIGPEWTNLRVALDWALHHGEAETALQLARGMCAPYWVSDAHVRETGAYLERALGLPGGTPAVRLTALVSAAWVAPALFDIDEALVLGERALARARQAGDEYGLADAASSLGVVRLHANDTAGAREAMSEALAGFRQLRARGRIAWTLCDLAALDSRAAVDEGGDSAALARARACYDEALAHFRAIGHPRSIARALHGLGYVTYKQRDLPRALASIQEVLTLAWEQRWPVFAYLEDIADIAGRVGQPVAAARLYGAADAQREQFGVPIEPPYRDEYERDVAVARWALGDEAFVAARRAGHTLEPEQAVADALAITIKQAVSPPAVLSPRELEVLRLLASGLSDRDIAGTLFIGERTVNTHVARAFVKLGVHNRAAAVAAAIAAGLLHPPLPGTSPS